MDNTPLQRRGGLRRGAGASTTTQRVSQARSSRTGGIHRRRVKDTRERRPGRASASPEGDRGVVLRNRFSERVFRRAALASALPPGTNFHDLRHYYASLLISHGESVKVVQSRLGHASAKETLDTYSHLWPDSEDTTRSAVESVLRRPQHEESTAIKGT
ncbi:MAG: hypothetical protein QOI86_4967 [Actinomycetota bacterium]|jgi:integrase|nr:hypothetical protein [Actinomycetota bacterium]